VTDENNLRRAALEIFDAALRSVDALQAVRKAVRLEGSRLSICETKFDLSLSPKKKIYALAIGKAAVPMALALESILGPQIFRGLIVGSNTGQALQKFSPAWRIIEGSHPLPDEASLKAAEAAFALLHLANEERALVIFLISGGGSAMIEWPRDEQITPGELREANRVLVSCGASIDEINAVRRSFSAIKGGRLALRAPLAEQVSLIISDTGRGSEAIVASGPTCYPPEDAPDAAAVIERYNLTKHLPASILRVARQPEDEMKNISTQKLREHFVLLDNETALEAAAAEARRLGFMVEIARDISEQEIAEGCNLMLSRIEVLRQRAAHGNGIACLISGGEFACPVNGDGIGGRNAETVLRCAMLKQEGSSRFAILSAGTDGIDGNSRAAGAIADETTIERARELKLDARDFLKRSDAFSFFNAVGDAVITGPTGTNVRDLRIVLAES
jgi:Putative glycerate kinase